MFPIKYKGYRIAKSINSGGKAGKGRNKTSTIWVVGKSNYGKSRIKQFRYNVHEYLSLEKAIGKAKKYVDDGLPGSEKHGIFYRPYYNYTEDCNPLDDVNISDYVG